MKQCPCVIYRQLNSILQPGNYIPKSSKIIFNWSVKNNFEYCLGNQLNGNERETLSYLCRCPIPPTMQPQNMQICQICRISNAFRLS